MTFQKSKIARVVQLNPSQQQNVRHDINADVTVFSLGSDDPLNPNEQGHANFLQSDSSFIIKK